MNFTKKLVAVSAIFLAATLANAQTLPAPFTLPMSITLNSITYMDVNPLNASGGAWIWEPTSTPAGSDLKAIASIVVETNMPAWDVTVSSQYGGLLRKTGTAVAGDTLKGINGTKTDPVKVQLFTCVDKPSAYSDGLCTIAGTTVPTTAALTGGKVDAFSGTTAVSLSKASGKTSGFQQADMEANTTACFTTSCGSGDPANYLRIGLYAGLYSTATATAYIAKSKLVGDSEYKDTYTISLTKRY